MKRICRELQGRLAAEGRHAVRDDAAAQIHLEACADCFAVLESLAQLDEALPGLTMTDAPEAVVESLLAQVKEEGTPTPEAKPAAATPFWKQWALSVRQRPMLWTGAAAAAAMALLVPVLSQSLMRARISAPTYERPGDAISQSQVEPAPKTADLRRSDESDDALRNETQQRDEFAKRQLSAEKGEQLRAFGDLGSGGSVAAEEALPSLSARNGAVEFHANRENVPKKPSSTTPRLRELGETESNAPQSAGVGRGVASGLTGIPEEIPVDEAFASEFDSDFEGGARLPEPPQSGVLGGLAGSLEDRASGSLPDPNEPETKEKDKKDLLVRAETRVIDASRKGERGAFALGGAEVAGPTKLYHVDPVAAEPEQRTVALEITIDPDGRVIDARVERSLSPERDAAALEAVKQWRYEPTRAAGVAVPVTLHVEVSFVPKMPGEEQPPLASGPAYDFHQERHATQGVRFQPATGYWSNTYIPGDPRVRRLSHELSESPYARLHEQARQLVQPFDAPQHSALAVYMHTDRRGHNGPGRMLVQVGLQASERSGQRRTAVDLALVLDLRGDIPVDVASRMRALVLAFSQARLPGDRFSLIVAGRPGAVVIEPDVFRHGPLAISLDTLLQAGSTTAPGLDLPEAISRAFEQVGQGDDDTRALGSSAIVLVTGQSVASQTDRLARLLHRGAVAAIPTSVVAVGQDVSRENIERLALAGQGQHRVLESRAQAARLVGRELASASRAVARALRLRIRLAPGVELIDVVGAYRLGTRQADRVREAEQAIDARLARHLGIEADRGEDEDGIQILIPSFYAGDTHVILLDVVAQSPGRVAEVTARFKDLVFLRNGVSRASASTRRDDLTTGALELNVVKNQLARRLSDSLRAAAEALRDGRTEQAEAVLREAAELRTGIGSFYPGLMGDLDLRRDAAMLAGYLQVLTDDPQRHPDLVPSLRYASHLKVLPRPAPVALSGP